MQNFLLRNVVMVTGLNEGQVRQHAPEFPVPGRLERKVAKCWTQWTIDLIRLIDSYVGYKNRHFIHIVNNKANLIALDIMPFKLSYYPILRCCLTFKSGLNQMLMVLFY